MESSKDLALGLVLCLTGLVITTAGCTSQTKETAPDSPAKPDPTEPTGQTKTKQPIEYPTFPVADDEEDEGIYSGYEDPDEPEKKTAGKKKTKAPSKPALPKDPVDKLAALLPVPDQNKVVIANSVKNDTLDKPDCPVKNSSRAHCKDPNSYVKSNESRHYLFRPYIKNLGGGYLGVGADASYSFIAYARSRWAWVMDYDPVVVRLHRMLRVLILKYQTPIGFVKAFHPRRVKKTLRIFRKAPSLKGDYKKVKQTFKRYRPKLYAHYLRIKKPSKTYRKLGWLRNKSAYRYIKRMYKQKRLVIVAGDLLKKAPYRIAQAAGKMGIPINIYYPSNAEEFWDFTKQYKKNIGRMPFGAKSLTLRTMSPHRVHKRKKNRWHNSRPGRYWHYVVHRSLNFQQKIKSKKYTAIDSWKKSRKKTKYEDLSTIAW